MGNINNGISDWSWNPINHQLRVVSSFSFSFRRSNLPKSSQVKSNQVRSNRTSPPSLLLPAAQRNPGFEFPIAKFGMWLSDQRAIPRLREVEFLDSWILGIVVAITDCHCRCRCHPRSRSNAPERNERVSTRFILKDRSGSRWIIFRTQQWYMYAVPCVPA